MADKEEAIALSEKDNVMVVKEVMLTTTDNPWNPFDHYDEWYAYDTKAGHHSLAYLARIVVTSEELSELDQSLAIELAVDEIVRENLNGLYKKVSQKVAET